MWTVAAHVDMRFVHFDEGRLGLLTDDGIVDLTDRLGIDSRDPLLGYIRGEYDASEYADADPDYARDEVELKAPIRRPGKVVAAPLNYENHIAEAIADKDITTDEWFSIEDKGYFLKAPSSVVGPDHGVELPFSDRRVDHEIELAFVMGADVKDVSAEEAWDHIFGYTVLLDISVRGAQDRSNRKSYDTFTVVGPCVVTPDEVGDPQDLQMELRLNGERRQYENTSDMVYTCADVVQYASIGATLEAGDVVTTGTPEGVSALSDGDTIDARIENVGRMVVDVTERAVRFEDVDVQKGGQE
jgi:2-keto-4-pentenoate hydratase/2-oxohepta-3-ene-1,7-dioic acid hydratase in catechol pathway